jgi:hypothetical protein
MMARMMKLGCLLAAALAVAAVPSARVGAQGDDGFAAYVQVLAARARARRQRGDDPERDRRSCLQPARDRTDRSQPGTSASTLPRLHALSESHVDAARIGRGRAMYRALPDPAAIERAMACRCRCCWRSGARKPIMAR